MWFNISNCKPMEEEIKCDVVADDRIFPLFLMKMQMNCGRIDISSHFRWPIWIRMVIKLEQISLIKSTKSFWESSQKGFVLYLNHSIECAHTNINKKKQLKR